LTPVFRSYSGRNRRIDSVNGCRFSRRWISADLESFFEHWQKSNTQKTHSIAAASLDEIQHFQFVMSLPFPVQFGTLGV
jgi:hypothetical protein